jgi:hypothetical protein
LSIGVPFVLLLSLPLTLFLFLVKEYKAATGPLAIAFGAFVVMMLVTPRGVVDDFFFPRFALSSWLYFLVTVILVGIMAGVVHQAGYSYLSMEAASTRMSRARSARVNAAASAVSTATRKLESSPRAARLAIPIGATITVGLGLLAVMYVNHVGQVAGRRWQDATASATRVWLAPEDITYIDNSTSIPATRTETFYVLEVQGGAKWIVAMRDTDRSVAVLLGTSVTARVSCSLTDNEDQPYWSIAKLPREKTPSSEPRCSARIAG